MEEIYKTIVGYENYEVSNYGNVKNIKFNRILKTRINTHGYFIIDLYSAGKGSTKTIHRLIAGAFLANPGNKNCIDHIDGNKLNNNVSNLRYATHSENSQNRKLNINSSSGTKGVYFKKAINKWRAQITLDGIQIHLGYFENKEDAIQCRIIKANQAFGIFTNACEQINEI